jgi:hypothetical protein
MKLTKATVTLCLLSVLYLPLCYAQGSNTTGTDIEQLKAKLAEQQKQLDTLRQSIADQQKLIDSLAKSADPTTAAATPAAPGFTRVGGAVASTTGALPATPDPAQKQPMQTPQPEPVISSPLQLQLGNITIMPVGFMDDTMVWRNKDTGSGIGSNFGSVPFDSAVPGGKLSELRFSPQNSRIGFRVDGNYKGYRFIGYNEFDFLGTSGANNIGITNGAFVPRLRLYWVDVRKDAWEIMAGQSWSLLTPNRVGLSPLPGDVFYSQVMDVNYVAGLNWTRQPGVRFVLHAPQDKVSFGVAFENPNQYLGSYGGSGQPVLPSALTALAGSQFDNGSSSPLSTPNLMPDIIAKLAFDPDRRAHVEIAGIVREFKDINPVSTSPTYLQKYTATGAGASVNANLEVAKGIRLIANNTFGQGIGRYIFGEAPDAIIRSNGSISPVHTFNTVEGIEATYKKSLFFFYAGGIYIQKNIALDANGTTYIGWGYPGAANSQDHSINEYTFGLNQTVWKDAKYGAISFIGQYEYLTRSPWTIPAGTPANALDHTIYLDIRYTLPGAPPSAKK